MEYRTLYLPIGLPYSGKTTMAEIFKDIYNGDLFIGGIDRAREELYPGYFKGEIDFDAINANDVFIHAIKTLEEKIETNDVWWDATNLSRQTRAVVAFSAQKICHVTKQDIKVVAIDFKVPFNEILTRYWGNSELERHNVPISKLENMFKVKLTEPLNLESENIDEIFAVEWVDENWELIEWKVSDKCSLIDANDTKVADLVREVKKRFEMIEKVV